MTCEVIDVVAAAAQRACMNTTRSKTSLNTTLRRWLVLDGLTGLVSIIGWLAQPYTWAGWLGVEASTVQGLALVLTGYVGWIAALLVSPSVPRARVLVVGNVGYALAGVVTVIWAVTTSSLTTFGIVNAAGHAVFVGGLAVAQHRALRRGV